MRGTKSGIVTVLFVTGLVLFSVLCFAEPYLVSDPYAKSDDQPTEFLVVSGSLKLVVPAERLQDGSVRLKLDLSQFPDGEQPLQIRAVSKPRGMQSDPTFMKLRKNGKEFTILQPEKEEPPKAKRPPSRTIPGLLKP